MPTVLDSERAQLLAYRSAASRRAAARHRRAAELDLRAARLVRQADELRVAAIRDLAAAPKVPTNTR